MAAVRKLHNTKWGESRITVQWEQSKEGKDGVTSNKEGLGTKHYSQGGLYVCVLYGSGCSCLKWEGRHLFKYSISFDYVPGTVMVLRMRLTIRMTATTF